MNQATLPEYYECFKLGIRWTDYIFETDADAFDDILKKCDCNPWSFDKGVEKDSTNASAVKISFKPTLTEDELDKTRNELFSIFEKAHNQYKMTHMNLPFHITNEIMFPRTISGFVIGKKGHTLWGIKERTGVDLLLIDDLRGAGASEPPPEGYDRLLIKGQSINSVREARECVKQLLKSANNLVRQDEDAETKFERILKQSVKQPLIRADSGELLFEMSPPPKQEKSRRKYLLPKQPSPSNAEYTAEELLFELPCNDKTQIEHKTSGSSTYAGRNQNQSGFGRFFSSKFHSQTTKANGIQRKRVVLNGIQRGETHASDSEDGISMCALPKTKKRRNEYEYEHSPEPLETNRSSQIQESIMAFMQQGQETAKCISEWIANEQNLADKCRRLENKIHQMTVENRQLKAELYKYRGIKYGGGRDQN